MITHRLGYIVVVSFLCGLVAAGPGHKGIPGFEKSLLPASPVEVTLNDRLACLDGNPDGEQPPDRADTTAQVESLIELMNILEYDAYIIPSSDAHQSEYTSAADERRSYMSGFTGSAGTAVILADGTRALWTDGRYFLQADDQMDCQWLLMKSGEPGVPEIAEWIMDSLPDGSVVGADARLLGADTWIALSQALEGDSISLVVEPIDSGNNIVDQIWNDDGRPAYSMEPIFIHEVEFAGLDWQDKIQDLQADMEEQGVDVLVLTALDEVAWTLNLRGSDIAYNPVFRSYLIIDTLDGTNIQFFAPNSTCDCTDCTCKVPQVVRDQRNIDNCPPGELCVSLKEYDTIGTELANLTEYANMVWLPSSYDTSSGVSYYIYNTVPEEKRYSYRSPALLRKAAKNSVEQSGMKQAHIKDAVALIDFLAFMEEEIESGNNWTELSAQIKLDEYRAAQENYMGDSFGTISAFGPNGAIIHYEASNDTDTQIDDTSLYLLDSGGQYKDGTTDVTRTMHYGVPTPYEVEAYTRVLMGQIDFATISFPQGTDKSYIDILARKPLYNVGLNYRHGTSHGVGMFLNVHEGSSDDFELGFHCSDEPGYYEDGAFGIRLENVVAVVPMETKYNFTTESYKFETITLVPYEPKLINTSLLNYAQCSYLNLYNQQIRDQIAETKFDPDSRAYQWIISKTEQLSCS